MPPRTVLDLATPRVIRLLEPARFDRRALLRGGIAATLAGAFPRRLFAKLEFTQPPFTFAEIANTIDDRLHVPSGYRATPLIRFGDPVLADAPEFTPGALRAADQAKQFGYGNDYVTFLPLPRGSRASDRGLLCVNHETTEPILMWSGISDRKALTEEQVAIEMAALGHSVIEIARGDDGRFAVVPRSRFARRLDATTEMEMRGPAAGDARLRTHADPSGTLVLGTFNDCAGGTTPWGTVLLAEENFHKHFVGNFGKGENVADRARLGFDLEDETEYGWGFHHPRFNVDREPNEPFRFGWIVELDPFDPHSRPKKRTALGRFKHEGATCVLDDEDRVVVYSGDDDRFEYLYRFVSHGRFDPEDRARNHDLLESGTLFVARFDENGGGRWIPLVFGTNGLTPANGFHSQADVVIEARRAADVVGATPLDRPEDVEANPVTGKVYVNLTNNKKRKAEQVDVPNPREKNFHGHILELVPPSGRNGKPAHSSLDFTYSVFLLAGDPRDKKQRARYHPGVTENGWFSSPDNVTFDRFGRLWVTTDQGEYQKSNAIPDGMRAIASEGDERALPRLFLKVPRGAELCGPCFTPDNKTLFVAVQHPGEGEHGDSEKTSTYDDPSTRWPDFDPTRPPRPAIVQIDREDGGEIG